MITKWKMAHSFVAGRLHEKKDLPCQDRTYHLTCNGVEVIVLADGAGSSKHSDRGAEIVTKETAEYVSKYFCGLLTLGPEEMAKTLLKELLKKLHQQSSLEGNPVKDYASTLLFAAICGSDYIAGHLGDGVIASLQGDSTNLFSLPEQGEFSNTTFFTTSPEAERHLRIYTGKIEDRTGFVLMSDGAAESLFLRKEGVMAPAIQTFKNWLRDFSCAEVSQALSVNLERMMKAKTNDDCSIALMVRVDLPYEAALSLPAEKLADFQGASSPYVRRDVGKKKNILVMIYDYLKRIYYSIPSFFRFGKSGMSYKKEETNVIVKNRF